MVKSIQIIVNEQFSELRNRNICLSSSGYPQITVGYHHFTVHSYIATQLGWNLIGAEIDHKNGNKLDNRIANLRVCQRHENMANRGVTKANTSGYKGVSFDKQTGKWRGQIMYNGKTHSAGRHLSVYDAALARDQLAINLGPEFSYTNFDRGLFS